MGMVVSMQIQPQAQDMVMLPELQKFLLVEVTMAPLQTEHLELFMFKIQTTTLLIKIFGAILALKILQITLERYLLAALQAHRMR